jgi:hypothetical protein
MWETKEIKIRCLRNKKEEGLTVPDRKTSKKLKEGTVSYVDTELSALWSRIATLEPGPGAHGTLVFEKAEMESQ